MPLCFEGPARSDQGVSEACLELRRPFGSLFGESARPFRGAATAVLLSLEGVLERFSTSVSAIGTLTAPVFRILKAALPPRLTFPKNAKRFCQALEMLARRRNTVKIGISAVLGPKPWDPPRRAENGPPALFDEQPNGRVWDTRPEPDFPGFRLFHSLNIVL